MFEIYPKDKKLVRQVKEEANLLLSSIHHDVNKSIITNEIEFIVDVAVSIENCAEIYKIEDVDKVMRMFNKFYDSGLLSPLTLNINEFEEVIEGSNINQNKRYPHLYLNNEGVYYTKAFVPKVTKAYNDSTKQELKIIDEKYTNSYGINIIHITAGGVFTNRYFSHCYINSNTIRNGKYFPKDSIQLPVSVIVTDKNEWVYSMDMREPKFKALCEFYKVIINTNDKFKNMYDIRKYKKL